jgi:hypothetical protein
MIGTKFKAQSGNDYEWFVFKSHGLFTDVWHCYPIKRWDKDNQIKESFVQCFDTAFIKQNEIYEQEENSTLLR